MKGNYRCHSKLLCFHKEYFYIQFITLLFFVFILFYVSKHKDVNKWDNDSNSNSNSNQYITFPDMLTTNSNDLNTQFHNYIMHSRSDVYDKDVYKNPYTPPLKPLWNQPTHINHVSGHPHTHILNTSIPINVSTSYRNVEYRQIGILTRNTDITNKERERETILALFGRPLHTSRSKWQYYTMTDKSNGIKLPIKIIRTNGKQNCKPMNFINTLSSYGCDELFSGDIVKVDGYHDNFVVTVFDSDTLEYIP